LAGAITAKILFLNRRVVNVTVYAGVVYMLANLEVPLRFDLGITTIHINSYGFTGFGPGF